MPSKSEKTMVAGDMLGKHGDAYSPTYMYVGHGSKSFTSAFVF